MKDIVIIGAGGFAREVAWLIEDINKKEQQWNLLGFIDDNLELQGKEINGYKVIGTIEDYQKMSNEIYSVIAIGTGSIRKLIVEKLKNRRFATLIHPTVLYSKQIKIEEGSIICAGNILTVNITIGKHVILNLTNTIGHDTNINDFVTVLPGCNISGEVSIEEGSIIGTGVKIRDEIKIGKNCIVGMGSIVTKDIEANKVFYNKLEKMIFENNLKEIF